MIRTLNLIARLPAFAVLCVAVLFVVPVLVSLEMILGGER